MQTYKSVSQRIGFSSYPHYHPKKFVFSNKLNYKTNVLFSTQVQYFSNKRNERNTLNHARKTSSFQYFPITQLKTYCTNEKESLSKEKEATKLLQRVWTIPNILSCARMALAPVVGYFVITEQPVIAIGILISCAISDVVDGWIARKFNQQSALGSVLDPIGDKLIIGSLSISLLVTGQLPLWLFTMILSRDLVLVLFSFYIRSRIMTGPITLKRFVSPTVNTAVVNPTFISKLNTALQFILLGLTVTSPIFPIIEPTLYPLQILVGATTFVSFGDYLINYKKSMHVIPKDQI